ncbi:MAG TPA: hypothetical protein VHM65_06115 [Candidatus Lustribacter sp.]|nr:hypothetical protein [Candidatus Lustribacter sp.]
MNEHVTPAPRAASFDLAAMAVVIHRLTVTHPSVVSEARRWSTGQRGAALAAEEMAGADLGAFVTQALAVGSQAIALAAGAQDTFELERLVTEVGAKTAESSAKAAEVTGTAVTAAAEAVSKAVAEANKAFVDADAQTRKSLAETVGAANASLQSEVQRIFGGDNPELLAKLKPLLESVGHQIGEQALEQTDKLLAKVGRQFDPADPTSPFAKQAAALAEQQKSLTASMDKNHLALVGKVDELARAVEVQKAAQAAVARTAKVTPLKGGAYETAVNAVMDAIAAGLGDEYTESGTIVGALPGCKKGDGVLTIKGGLARVVVEMHDSGDRRVWNDYLDEAERNREAAASIGLVPCADQNGGQTIRVLGARRVVVAFGPATDEPDLLRTVVQLMRVSAIAASSRRDVEDLATAEEHIHAAEQLLERVNKIRSSAGTIRKSADAIEKECNTVQTGMQNHLGQALDALAGVALEPVGLVELVGDASHKSGSAFDAA